MRQYRTPIWRPWILTIAMLPALLASGCASISGPGDVSGLARVADLDTLATAQGKTLADQDRIDTTMARGCATGLALPARCAAHSEASDARRQELEAD